jgi:hypothetical protein
MVGGFKALLVTGAFTCFGCGVILQPKVDELDHVRGTELFQTCQGLILYELREAAQVSETIPDTPFLIAMSLEVCLAFINPGTRVQTMVLFHGFRGPSNPSSC